MADLQHECGIAAVYHVNGGQPSGLVPDGNPLKTSRLIPGMLLDMQNRGQVSAGFTTYDVNRSQIIDTHRDVGVVSEVFCMSQEDSYQQLMSRYEGTAAIGHVRYATCGRDDRSYAQPFERHHISRSRWFSFAFNGHLANRDELETKITSRYDYHIARETDTEVLLHLISHELSLTYGKDLLNMLRQLSEQLDGCWNLSFLDAAGRMFVCRDPLGMRPLCYAFDGTLFAAASESVALRHLGFRQDHIKDVQPGTAVMVDQDGVTIERFAESERTAHCFFEWIYFANVSSKFDSNSVYTVRKKLGEKLAELEAPLSAAEKASTIVVPVPDTAKAAADSMAYQLGVPSIEGLIRNRYVGRTFIEGTNRSDKAKRKYTPLKDVLCGKRVLLVDDSIVRATTLKVLISQLREVGEAAEVHVRITCPPIIGTCYYGINIPTLKELFAWNQLKGEPLTDERQQAMADHINADSLTYLPVDSLADCIGLPASRLCQACVDGNYPTPVGQECYVELKRQTLAGQETAPVIGCG